MLVRAEFSFTREVLCLALFLSGNLNQRFLVDVQFVDIIYFMRILREVLYNI